MKLVPVLLLAGLCFSVSTHQAESYKIIMLSIFGSKSHLNMFYSVGETLAEAGHKVTLVSPYPPRNSTKIKEIFFSSDLFEQMQKDTKKISEMLLGNMDPKAKSQSAGPWKMFFTDLPNICAHILDQEIIKNFVKDGQQYDVAINNAFMNECTMPVAVAIAKHLVQLSTAGLSSLMAHELNVPFPYSTNPSIILAYTSRMTFVQRAINSVANFGFYAASHVLLYPQIDNIFREKYPGLMTVNEAKRKTSLLLLNRISATDGSIPTLPYVQEIGGINNVPAKELPKDLKTFVEGSGEAGFIYVALGSAVPEEFMPEDKKRIFIEAFSKIPQRVIWKFKEKRTDLPPNVKTVSWAPQQDILGHPKCKAFISHGGHLSLDESMYHGVPAIGMPLFGDQPANVAHGKALGWALEQLWMDLTVDSLVQKLNEITSNPKYKEMTKTLSKRMMDQPLTAKEKTVFWVEYVARHDGAMHLRTAAENLNFFQYFLLDVIGAAVLAVSITFYILYKILNFIFCKLCCGKKNTDRKKLKSKKNN